MWQQEVANTLWSYATLSHDPGNALLDAMAIQMVERIQQFRPQAISNSLWAYAKLGYNPGKELLAVTSRRAQTMLHQYTSQVLLSAGWGGREGEDAERNRWEEGGVSPPPPHTHTGRGRLHLPPLYLSLHLPLSLPPHLADRGTWLVYWCSMVGERREVTANRSLPGCCLTWHGPRGCWRWPSGGTAGSAPPSEPPSRPTACSPGDGSVSRNSTTCSLLHVATSRPVPTRALRLPSSRLFLSYPLRLQHSQSHG